MAPPVERGLILCTKEVAVIAEINSTKLTSSKSIANFQYNSGYMVGITTAVVELTQDKIPEEAAIMGTAVRSVVKELKPSEISLIPPKYQSCLQNANTANHDQRTPGNTFNSFLFVCTAQKDKNGSITKAKGQVSV